MRPLLRFFLSSSVPLALRTGIPVVTGLTVACGLRSNPAGFLEGLTRALAQREGGVLVPWLLSFTGLAAASWAAPRAAYGLSSYLRHLPLSAKELRRALQLALIMSQGAMALIWTVLWLGAAGFGHRADPSRLAAMPLAIVSGSWLALPIRPRRISVPTSALALALALSDRWMGLLLSASLLVGLERFAGSELMVETRPRRRRAPPFLLPAAIALRAMRWRLAPSLAFSAFPLLVAKIFLTNNRLDPELENLVLRLSLLTATSWLVAASSATLAERRPPWPWSRSLPRSASSRVLEDALLIGAAGLPHFGLFVWLFGGSETVLLPALGHWIYASIRGAARLRQFPDADEAARGLSMIELFMVAGALALAPGLALASPVASLMAFHHGRALDRRLSLSGWNRRRSLTIGDPMSWRD